MSDAAADTGSAIADFLATVPLLEGIPQPELEELAGLLRRREWRAGEVLWRQGDEAHGMELIVDGRVSISLRLPGDRHVELASAGPGEVLGEIPLLDGGDHSATARVAERATLLSLSRADFAALVARRHPTAFILKRRITAISCARLRRQHGVLATSLGADTANEQAEAAPPPAELEFCGPPDSGYVRRLATFRSFDSLALWGFLTAGRYARCPAGRTVVAEGAVSPACYLTINGAVEKVIVRGGRRIRVGLAGPGQAFGYESLIDGGPSPVAAITRERTLMLVLPREAFERLFQREEPGSHVFLDVIHRDLMAALRQGLRPQARLAVSL
jgi:CRP/FNR family transcriptional regulator, cyclic AMP receptor protein